MPRRISSSLTFFYKFASFPLVAVWLIFFALFGAIDDPGGAIPFAVFGLMIAGFWIWMSWKLKKVSIDDRNLYVSNYRTEVTVPITDIEDVREFLLSEPRRVTIYLKQPTEFGSKIVFLATYRAFAFLSPHPIVDELIQMSYRQTMAAP